MFLATTCVNIKFCVATMTPAKLRDRYYQERGAFQYAEQKQIRKSLIAQNMVCCWHSSSDDCEGQVTSTTKEK